MSEQVTTGKDKQLRRLLPAPASTSQTRPPSLKPDAARHSRQTVRAACDPCRKRKTRCSGGRPSCRRCAQKRIQCLYNTQQGETPSQALERRYNDVRSDITAYQELIELLRTLPASEAEDILQRIRSGIDVVTILNHVKAGDLLLQLAVTPETRFRYKFPYLSEMPKDYGPDNPYLKSLVYEAALLYPSEEAAKSSDPATPISSPELNLSKYRSIYLKPFHAARVVDPLLLDVKPSLWTTVCKDDLLMRDLLGVFFHCEYHFTSAFQKDLFLEDMASQRQEFCSSLLVNITLAYSCVCYSRFLDRAEYWNPNTLVYRFLAEAKRIWELEATTPRITTIQAGILFSVFHNLSGLDEIGVPYRIQAVALTHKLDLFSSTRVGENDRTRNGRAFVAWTLFNWETLTAFSFLHRPLITQPPNKLPPDPSHDEAWCGEIWVKYPLDHALSPSYFGHVFKAKCQLRIIMNNFCQEAYGKDSDLALDKAGEIGMQLKEWYDNLPEPLLPQSIVLPGHLELHMYYYILLLNIYEPLLEQTAAQVLSTREIVDDATKKLQTLIRLYYLRHGFDAMDLFIVIPLVLTGFKCLDAINDQTPASKLESLRSTLVLVTHGLHSQRRNHHLATSLFSVIRGRMRQQEAALLKDTDLDEVEDNEKERMIQAVRSHWPVSVVKKKDDLDSHILTNLIQSSAHTNIEEQR